jgi:hypothetical protein
MTLKHDAIAQALDHLAEKTGVPSFIRSAEERKCYKRARRQIVIPAIAIVGSIIAFVATLYGVRLAGSLSVLFFLLAMVAKQFGPIRLSNTMAPYDEREQLLIWRSRSIGMGVALGLSILGCFAYSFYDAFHDESWRLPTNTALAATWLLATTGTALTTICASLLLPKQIADDED